MDPHPSNMTNMINVSVENMDPHPSNMTNMINVSVENMDPHPSNMTNMINVVCRHNKTFLYISITRNHIIVK